MSRAVKIVRELWRTWNTNWPNDQVKRVLVLQSASPTLFLNTVKAVRERFAGAEVHAAVHEYCLPHLPPDFVQRFFPIDRKDKLGFISLLRRNEYDTVVICVTGEGDFWKPKLMGFCIKAKQVLCYNEHGGAFVCNRWHYAAMLRHFRYCLSRRSTGRRRWRAAVWSGFLSVTLGPVAVSAWMLRAIAWEARRLLNTVVGYAARK
jgi:hypothetical protein